MSTNIIVPDELDRLATAPQCVDNQFVPYDLFKRLNKKKKTLKEVTDRILEEHGGDPFLDVKDEDANLLLVTQRNEYNRALIFSRQVIVNRAAFWNTPALVVSELTDDVDALAELIKNRRIVPYLYKEDAFDDPPKKFGTIFGERAMNRLLTAIGTETVNCVRLALSKRENEIRTDILSKRFRTELIDPIKRGNDDALEQIAYILLPENVDQEEFNAMKEKIRKMARKIDNLAEKQPIGREDVYKAFITVPETNPAHGLYRSGRFVFEIKKWVDAIYTSNLPDALGILTFAPEEFPTAYDLGMSWSLGRKVRQNYAGSDMITEVIDRTKSQAILSLWNEFQKGANLILPSPDQLTHHDILEIRELGAWEIMMTNLENFVDMQCESTIMVESFAQFNRALSSWYLKKTDDDRLRTAEKFAIGIGRIYQLGEWMVGMLYGQDGQAIPILPSLGVKPPDLNANDLRFGIEAGLFFINQRGINWRRSQLIQRMEHQLVVGVEDVRKLIDQITTVFPETVPYLKPTLTAEMQG